MSAGVFTTVTAARCAAADSWKAFIDDIILLVPTDSGIPQPSKTSGYYVFLCSTLLFPFFPESRKCESQISASGFDSLTNANQSLFSFPKKRIFLSPHSASKC